MPGANGDLIGPREVKQKCMLTAPTPTKGRIGLDNSKAKCI